MLSLMDRREKRSYNLFSVYPKDEYLRAGTKEAGQVDRPPKRRETQKEKALGPL